VLKVGGTDLDAALVEDFLLPCAYSQISTLIPEKLRSFTKFHKSIHIATIDLRSYNKATKSNSIKALLLFANLAKNRSETAIQLSVVEISLVYWSYHHLEEQFAFGEQPEPYCY
jgi:hypothetical protein